MRLDPKLARRLDRLARRAHAFHRFAHHPLCDRYASELIQLGPRRKLCRGCSLALAGALAGGTLAACWPLPPSAAGVSGLAVLAAAAGALSWSQARVPPGRAAARENAAPPRASKWLTRALPAAIVTGAFVSCLDVSEPLALLWLAALAAAASGTWFAYRRRGPERSACTGCPESARVPCSGFRDIVRAERAFARRAGQLIDRASRGRL